ncbi:hypothetical protein A2814_02825 [Candidatus Nomurabacteria bacterium RIFCSPHIGHO2_01_FULL_38_19]|uniref:DUF3298 domain-containing protein n=1 Tax=Candidatus Nomurabacteria bacterium RIFCSPHIGHO2_01_FULL_38_19 TaxID=1801732 RepID=A0A1F6USA0_9BACT|nr:MAG: hypothetical protein A2814_02825 [Candidatus Nomurabacteria bacterium RIFCSPHIGHO2_01_FULL_38_19]
MKKKNKPKGIVYLVVLVILVVVGLYWQGRYNTTSVVPETPKEETAKSLPEISIGTENIKEENFSGTRPTISSTNAVAVATRTYIEERVKEFKTTADIDVPDMREKFGADSPTANYTIDISATEVQSEKTQSIVMSIYTYTGGANGHSSFKVITASSVDGKILSLENIIKKDRQIDFANFVKKDLKAWRPEGSTESVVFEDEVKNLNFDSFVNWSLDDKNLILYFDKYQIGPGALGAVAFSLKLEKIKNYLEPVFY